MKKRKTKKTVCQKAKKLFCFIFLSILIVSIIPAIYAFLFPNESNRLTAFQLWVFLVVLISTFFISRNIFDFYMIDYRFWKKVLAKRWLYRIVFCLWVLLTICIYALSFNFPNWLTIVFGGILLGLINALTAHGTVKGKIRSSPTILSYKKLYNYYITRADCWENKLQKHQEKREKKF